MHIRSVTKFNCSISRCPLYNKGYIKHAGIWYLWHLLILLCSLHAFSTWADNSGDGGLNISIALEERWWDTPFSGRKEREKWILSYFLIFWRHEIQSRICCLSFHATGVNVQAFRNTGNNTFRWSVSVDFKLAVSHFSHFLYRIQI